MHIRKLKGLALNRIEQDPDMIFMNSVDDFNKLKAVFELVGNIPEIKGTIMIFGTGGSLDKNKSLKDYYNHDNVFTRTIK